MYLDFDEVGEVGKGTVSGDPISLPQQPLPSFDRWFARGKKAFISLLVKVHTLLEIIDHPCSPRFSKWIAMCAAAYLFSPIQLIPNFIPVIGQLDDLALLLLAIALVRRSTPTEIFNECERRALCRMNVLERPSADAA
jgi:uncharacterized membrane protein YkvA (DUF1232 family)